MDGGNRRSLDVDGSFTGQEGNVTTGQRQSPVLMKRIKLEMPNTSQYQHPVGVSHTVSYSLTLFETF